MKNKTIGQLVMQKVQVKLELECMLLQRPQDVGIKWQEAQELLAAINAELASREGVLAQKVGVVL